LFVHFILVFMVIIIFQGAKLQKNERNAKEKFAFLLHFRVLVTSAKPKLQKNERNAKEKFTFLFISEC